MFGNGVWTYMTSPMTSGAPSWPRSTPVENVHAGRELADVRRVDLIEFGIAGGGEVAARRGPLFGVFLQRRLFVVGVGVVRRAERHGAETRRK